MGKKHHRKQQRRAASQAPAQPVRQPAVQAPEAVEEPRIQKAPTVPPRTRTISPSWKEFRERYRYVNAELKRIGVLAASFLVVLLILTAILG